MYVEEPIYAGYLLFPPQGKIVLKKSPQSKYCRLFNSSKLGIERLEVYDSEEDSPKETPNKILLLENCIKISAQDETSFAVITKTWCQSFTTTTTLELANWITALQCVAFKDNSSNNLTIVEDNELYSSSGQGGVFTVKLLPSEASKRCHLESKMYTLCISSTSMMLRDCDTNKTLLTWPHRFIRRYGYRGGKFTFEAGRKCESGEGSFHLEHFKQQEIFRCLSAKMQSMKNLLNDDTLDCDNQFQAALSMEARSRTPLPPSQPKYKEPTLLNDIITSSSSHVKQLIKPIPNKPPRKNLPQSNTYEPISQIPDYAKIEVRQNAWKTMGLDTIKHSETPLPETSIGRSHANLYDPLPAPPVSKVITTSNVKDSYDKLQFFGSKSELNELHGYKNVMVPPSAPSEPSTSFSLNDYEEVGVIQNDIQAVRLADDSHLGYGMIRKQGVKEELPVPLQQLTPHVAHQIVNQAEYAVISKPKRV